MRIASARDTQQRRGSACASGEVAESGSFSPTLMGEGAALLLLELYATTAALAKYRAKVGASEASAHFPRLFYVPLERWTHLIGEKLSRRLAEQRRPAGDEIGRLLGRVAAFWRRLAWPEEASGRVFCAELTRAVLAALVGHAWRVHGGDKRLGEGEGERAHAHRLLLAADGLHRLRESLKAFVAEMVEVSRRWAAVNCLVKQFET